MQLLYENSFPIFIYRLCKFYLGDNQLKIHLLSDYIQNYLQEHTCQQQELVFELQPSQLDLYQYHVKEIIQRPHLLYNEYGLLNDQYNHDIIKLIKQNGLLDNFELVKHLYKVKDFKQMKSECKQISEQSILLFEAQPILFSIYLVGNKFKINYKKEKLRLEERFEQFQLYVIRRVLKEEQLNQYVNIYQKIIDEKEEYINKWIVTYIKNRNYTNQEFITKYTQMIQDLLLQCIDYYQNKQLKFIIIEYQIQHQYITFNVLNNYRLTQLNNQILQINNQLRFTNENEGCQQYQALLEDMNKYNKDLIQQLCQDKSLQSYIYQIINDNNQTISQSIITYYQNLELQNLQELRIQQEQQQQESQQEVQKAQDISEITTTQISRQVTENILSSEQIVKEDKQQVEEQIIQQQESETKQQLQIKEFQQQQVKEEQEQIQIQQIDQQQQEVIEQQNETQEIQKEEQQKEEQNNDQQIQQQEASYDIEEQNTIVQLKVNNEIQDKEVKQEELIEQNQEQQQQEQIIQEQNQQEEQQEEQKQNERQQEQDQKEIVQESQNLEQNIQQEEEQIQQEQAQEQITQENNTFDYLSNTQENNTQQQIYTTTQEENQYYDYNQQQYDYQTYNYNQYQQSQGQDNFNQYQQQYQEYQPQDYNMNFQTVPQMGNQKQPEQDQDGFGFDPFSTISTTQHQDEYYNATSAL